MPIHAADSRPVHVLADHRLMGEAVAAALRSRGRSVWTSAWRFGPVRADRVRSPMNGPWSGVLVCDLLDPLLLAGARALVRHDEDVWLVIAAGPPDARWGALLDAGAGGVLPATTGLESLSSALERLEAGEEVTGHAASAEALAQWSRVHPDARNQLARLERLTPREREVLAGLCSGMPVAVLALQLEVSVATVRSQVRAVLRKLEVGTQIAAVAAVSRLEGSTVFAGPGLNVST